MIEPTITQADREAALRVSEHWHDVEHKLKTAVGREKDVLRLHAHEQTVQALAAARAAGEAKYKPLVLSLGAETVRAHVLLCRAASVIAEDAPIRADILAFVNGKDTTDRKADALTLAKAIERFNRDGTFGFSMNDETQAAYDRVMSGDDPGTPVVRDIGDVWMKDPSRQPEGTCGANGFSGWYIFGRVGIDDVTHSVVVISDTPEAACAVLGRAFPDIPWSPVGSKRVVVTKERGGE